MKNIKNINLFLCLFGLACTTLFLSSCQNEDADLTPATYSTSPDVFLDSFTGGLNYAAFSGTVPTAFQVDNKVTYGNTAQSMRFDVPNVNNRLGSYAGGAFFMGVGRDLSQYDALTFWVKSSEAAKIGSIGFGVDLGANKYQAGLTDLSIGTSWEKVIIPIPNPAVLTNEKGMLFVSAGNQSGNGFSFWLDEVKFEKLGTIAHPKATIFNGENKSQSAFNGVTANIDNLSVLFNMPWGTDLAVNASSSYFTFVSSVPAVATVNSAGVATLVGAGTSVITAKLGEVTAQGSLTLIGKGAYPAAPAQPTRDANRVISIFSNHYTNVAVDYFNGYWAPYQTTTSADFTVSGDNVLSYANFNFVGIEFKNPMVNATSMTRFHANIYIPSTVPAGATFKVKLADFGPDNAFGGTDDTAYTYTVPGVTGNTWITIDLPFSAMTTLTRRANLAQVVFEGTNIPAFYADNIYFYN